MEIFFNILLWLKNFEKLISHCILHNKMYSNVSLLEYHKGTDFQFNNYYNNYFSGITPSNLSVIYYDYAGSYTEPIGNATEQPVVEFPGAQTAIITIAIIGWIILLIVLIVLFFFYCRNKRGRYKL